MSKYNFSNTGSANGNNSDNSGYAPVFKTAPFIKLRGEPSGIYAGNSDFGQSIGVTYENGKLEDGILTKRTDKEQYKVFSWNDAPVIEDETLSCDDLPPVLTKSYGGSTYKYKILAARLEADEEVGYEDDVMVNGVEFEGTGLIPTSELITDDDGNPDARFTVYESAGPNGPNACAKTTAKVLTQQSHDAVVDEDSQFKWLADNLTLREGVEGEEIIYVKVQRESDQSEHSFYFPLFLDPVTEEMILPDNNAGESDEKSEPPEQEPMDDPDESPTDSSGPVEEFYETCEELEIDTEPAVLGLLEDMVADDDNDLTDSMIDREEIVADLVA